MNSNKAQNISVTTLPSFFSKKKRKIKLFKKTKLIIQLQDTEAAILIYLMLIVVIIYFVKSLNRYESILINQENSNFVTWSWIYFIYHTHMCITYMGH